MPTRKAPKKGHINAIDPWVELASAVLRQAFHDYYTEQIKNKNKKKVQSIRNFILFVDSPFHQMLEINSDLFPCIVTKIDTAIKKGEHYHVRVRPRPPSASHREF